MVRTGRWEVGRPPSLISVNTCGNLPEGTTVPTPMRRRQHHRPTCRPAHTPEQLLEEYKVGFVRSQGSRQRGKNTLVITTSRPGLRRGGFGGPPDNKWISGCKGLGPIRFLEADVRSSAVSSAAHLFFCAYPNRWQFLFLLA